VERLAAPTASQVLRDVQAVVSELPGELGPVDFSIALALVRSGECHGVAEGAYGVQVFGSGASSWLFRPRTWTDIQVEDGVITRKEAGRNRIGDP
jgi:hypothetical protein